MKTQTTIKFKITRRLINPESMYYRICPFKECERPFMASRTNQEYCCKQHYDTDYNWNYRRKSVLKLENASLKGKKRKVSECGMYIYAPSPEAAMQGRTIKVAYYSRKIRRSMDNITRLIQ